MRCFRIDCLRTTTGRQRPPLALAALTRLRSSLHSHLSTDSKNGDTRKSLKLLNKSIYDESIKCHRLGWFARRNKLPSDRFDLPKNPMKEFLIRQGVQFEQYVYAHKYGYHPPLAKDYDNKNNENNDCSHLFQPNNLSIVHEQSPIEAAKLTNTLMASEHASNNTDDPIDIILQPTFLCDNRVARADVAIRIKNSSPDTSAFQDDSWEILEIKSSTEKSFRKKIPDLAYTVFVARLAGYDVCKASLILVNPNYVRKSTTTALQDDILSKKLLYKTIDCTHLVNKYIVDNKMDEETTVVDNITGGELPPVEYKLACGKCELLGVECGPIHDDSNINSGDGGATTILPLKHGIWEIPRLSQKQFPDVLERALPTLELRDLDLAPDDSSLFLLTENQIKFFHAVATDTVVVNREELEKRLLNIAQRSPMVMYLDFEAVSVLNPPYPGMVPYEAMITQYSLHKHEQKLGDGMGGELSHAEYLSDPQRDCRKELLERLLLNLGYGKNPQDNFTSGSGNKGAILVYSSYEKTQLKKLAALFPEYSLAIADAIEHRLVDLEKIIKDCVSHPDFCGRSSIKVTLPALVPGFEQAYQDLLNRHESNGVSIGIADGGTASAAFADLISGVRSEATDIKQTRTALLEYCKLDTLALVEIHKALWKLI